MDLVKSTEIVNLSEETMKSLWQNRHPDLKVFICPLCKRERRLPCRSEPGSLKHYFWIGFTAITFTLLCWPYFNWKGLVSFIPFWTLFEVVYRIRVRTLLPCETCGFDPYLFRIDLKKAAGEVEQHWRKKFAAKGIPYPERTPQKQH